MDGISQKQPAVVTAQCCPDHLPFTVMDSISQIEETLGNIIGRVIQQRKSEYQANEDPAGEARIDFNKRNLSEVHKELPEDIARKCKFCGMTFKEHEQLGKHIAKEHPDEGIKEYGKESSYLFRHPEEANPATPSEEYSSFMCSWCGKWFKDELEYKKHIGSTHRTFNEFIESIME